MRVSPVSPSSLVALIVLFAACGSVEKKPTDGGGGGGTAAEEALAAHRTELLATPGVVAAAVTKERDAILLTVCADEVMRRIDTGRLGAPVEATLAKGAAAADCGCVHGGDYYGRDESWKSGCNSCRCGADGTATCTTLACRETIDHVVPFGRDADDLDGAGRRVVADVVRLLLDNPGMHVKVVGHAAAGEAKAVQLATRRAQAVKKALQDAGVDRIRLTLEGAGTSSGSKASVTFEVTGQ